jgi:hypothetical protein
MASVKTVANIQHPIVLHPKDFSYDDEDFQTFTFQIIKHPRSQRIYAFVFSKKDNHKCPLVDSCSEKQVAIHISPKDGKVSIERKHEHKPFMYSLKVIAHNKKTVKKITKIIEDVVESQKKLHYIQNMKET